MTVAVCHKCGAFKHGAFTQCDACGAIPTTQKEKADSIALTDHHYDRATLEQFSQEIKAGKAPSVAPSISSGFADAMNTEMGRNVMNMFQLDPEDEPEEPTDNSQEMASRLVMIESHNPGTVRMRHNPFVINQVVKVYKGMGYRKPFFKPAHQFVYDLILTQVPPMARILPSCLLAGPDNDEGMIQCWTGTGQFVGLQGLFQLSDFTSGGKDRIPICINIEPFYDRISDLLENPTG